MPPTDPNDKSPHLIVTSGLDGTARIWYADSAKTKWILDLRTEPGEVIEVNSAVFSHDGKKVLTAGSDNSVRSWSVETGQGLMKFEGHSKPVRVSPCHICAPCAYIAESPERRAQSQKDLYR